MTNRSSLAVAVVVSWASVFACVDTGKLPFQDDALLGGEPPGGSLASTCWQLGTLEACDDCCTSAHPAEADRWSELAAECSCGLCYPDCGDAVCRDGALSQITEACGDCVVACSDAACAAGECRAYTTCSDPCMSLPSSAGPDSGGPPADASSACSRVCAAATAQGCSTTSTCTSDCLADLASACQSAMLEVLNCHDTLGVVCSGGFVAGNDINPSPCSTQHALAESCGIDPF